MSTPTLLLVDDEASNVESLQRIFEREGMNILTAGDGREALDVLRKQRIDVVLTDLMMPGMNGLELGRRLQQANPDLKILYLTGFSDALFEERPILGANEAFVDKPISPTGLHQAVSMALYGHLTGLIRRVDAAAPKPAPIPQNTAWV